MRGLAVALPLALPLVAGACRIEDRTPAGSRGDESAILQAIHGYEGARDARVIRVDLRREGDLAAAWVTSRLSSTVSDGEWMDHFLLRRAGAEADWRILEVTRANRPAPAGR